MTPTPVKPLSVGNTVSAAFRLYRDRLSAYLGIAVKASIWPLLPLVVIIIGLTILSLSRQVSLPLISLLILIALPFLCFGIAKYIANLALIARLAFGTLTNHPETIQEASRHIMPKTWHFFLASTLFSLMIVGLYFCFFVISMVFAVAGGVVGASANNSAVALILILLGIVLLGVLLSFLIRFIVRFSILEVPLAVESNLTATGTLGRSWKLTKNEVGRIFWILLVAALITIPIQVIVSLLASGIQNLLIAAFSLDSTSQVFVLLGLLLSYALSLILSVFLVPFWQTLKATIYYDLRTRKEGLDLQLRKRGI